MITIYVKDFNGDVCQRSYDDIIFSLDFNTLVCPCCGHSGFVVHGYYSRHIINKTGKERLRILRLRCSYCHSTHAVLLSVIIPYSSVLLKDQIRIILKRDLQSLMIEKPQIDESCIRRITYNYMRFFKERMASFRFSFEDDVVKKCFEYFGINFNQFRRVSNILLC